MSSSVQDPTIVQFTSPGGAPMLAASIPLSMPVVVRMRVHAFLDPDAKIFHKVILVDMVLGVLTLIGVDDEFPPIGTLGAAAWTVSIGLVGLLLQPTVTTAAGVTVLVGWDVSTLP